MKVEKKNSGIKNAVVVAMTIVVGVGLVLLRDNLSGSESFGYADALYAPTVTQLELSEDVGMISVTYLGPSVLGKSTIDISAQSLDLDKEYVFTSERSSEFTYCIQTQSGERLVTDSSVTRWGDSYNTDTELAESIYFPLFEPGRHSVSAVFFRGLPSNSGGHIPIGDQYSVSFEISVPKRSSSDFDICATRVFQSPINDRGGFTLYLRSNYGKSLPWLDLDSIVLERKTQMGYMLVAEANGKTAYVYGADGTQYYKVEVKNPWEDAVYSDAAVYPMVVLQGINFEDEYLATMDFVENPDGTGERYTLQLRLKFSE